MKRSELNYYDEFIKMTEYNKRIIFLFRELIDNYNYSIVSEKVEEIHEQENMADKTQHGILNFLIKDFVPPIDREDIISLTRKLDDVVDMIDEVSIDLNILSVKELRNDIVRYIELMEEASAKMHELLVNFKDLKNYDELKKTVVEVNNIEEKGDKLYQESIRNLYDSNENPIEVSKWTTIYNRLEDYFDSIEHIADCVDEIFMKNS